MSAAAAAEEAADAGAGAAPGGWEDTKENFVPLKQGRAAAAVLATPLSSVKKGSSEVEAQKRSFLAAIEAAAEDPMPAWLKYIKWTQEQCCVQGGKAELQAVLESATSSLTAAGRYHGDVRLLRIWVQYADCLPDPSDVFLYLEDQGIGRHHALLYEAYATYLELAGAFSHAELVYTEGINRLAKPLDRLKQKQAAFQQRMAKRMQRQASEAALGMAAEAVGSGGVAGLPVRASLAPLVPLDAAPLLDENGQPIRAAAVPGRHPRQQQPASAASVAMGVQPALAAGSRGAGGGLWGPASMGAAAPAGGGGAGSGLGSLRLGVPGMLPPGQARQGGSSSSSSAAANAAPHALEVHVDDEFGPRGTGAIPTAFPPALQQHAALPGLAAVSKENSSQPGTWGGTRVKQAAVFGAPAATKLEVYEDEDSEEAEAGESAAAAAAAVAAAADAARQQQQQRGGLRQRLEAPAGAGEAVQQPARPTAAAAAGPGQQQAATRSRSSAAAGPAPPPPAAAAAGQGMPRGYDESLLTGPDGGEMSFEEHRAAAWRARQQARRRQQEQEQQQQEEEERQRAEQQQQAAQWMQQQPAAEPTVTINTRAAFDAMNCMFGGSDDTTMHAFSRAAAASAAAGGRRKSVGRGAAAAAAAAGADGGVTINTRAAFEAMNGMFGGGDDTTTMHAFSGAASGSGAGLAGRGMVSEPTVTINTRAAFDYMNDVFGGGGDATMGHTGALAAGARGHGNKGARSSKHSRLSMAAPGGAGSGAGGLLGVYEDTDFELGSKLAAAASSASAAAGGSSGAGLGLHEDTEFINPAAAGGMQGLYEDGGFYCAEDTEFLTRPVGGGGLQLHEDTDLLTRPVGGGGGGGTQPLLSRVNRLSLANDALTKGLANLREDSDSPSPSGPQQLDVCADTEFLTRPVGASAAAAGGSSMGGQQQQQPSYHDSSTAGQQLQRSKENLPEDSWRQPGVGDENAACHHHQQQQPPAYGRSGPSRFAPGSVPSSPGPSHPGTAASTPGRPPRTPGTPSAAGGPWAQPLESFAVMESPAVHAALADRQQQQLGTAGSSPAGSLPGGSPGWGAAENLPGDEASGGAAAKCLPPRSMADRAVRAAVLQPLSSSRAEALGVQVDPTATGGYEDDAAAVEGAQDGVDDGGAGQQQQQRVRQSPSWALRSLHFGRS